jgi:hypothetical protein
MKRSWIKRKTPMKRTAFQKDGVQRRNANIRRVSAKKGKYDRVWKPIHEAWLSQWDFCWHCKQRKPLTIQHISKRSRGGDYHDLCNTYAACANCNCGPLDHSDKACQVMQLATKKLMDPENYDLEKWTVIHKRRRISEEDIERFIREAA